MFSEVRGELGDATTSWETRRRKGKKEDFMVGLKEGGM